MNAADQQLISWLQAQINTGSQTVVVPAFLLTDASPAGLAEARALAKVCGVKLVVEA